MTDTNNELDIARDVFARKYEIDSRGHDDFCIRARRNEDYYLGGGLQWKAEHRREIEDSGRPCHEINDVMPAVNAAGGYQIANRMDIAYLPRGEGTDEDLAKAFSKYAKHCLDNTAYRDHETEIFLDGLIQQRGFLDMRMDFQTNTKGEIACCNLDPMDVGIDPDARDYDPDTWGDVTISRWMTSREIEGTYGKAAADHVVGHARSYGHIGTLSAERPVPRSQFGDDNGYFGADYSCYGLGLSYRMFQHLVRYLVIERQSFEFANTLIGEWPTGDIRILDGVKPEQIAAAISAGAYVSKRRVKRVRWETVVPDGVIFNGLVPYEHFTVIPFFPYFRRGRTRGMVDNAISPQDMTNKFVSQYAHVINSIANSGWDVEEGQLINMTPEQLEKRGHETGLVVVRKKGSPPLKKITPNQVPQGLNQMIEYGAAGIQRTTSVNESLRGMGTEDMSGIAIQSRQFAAQQQLAIPLWRLSQTRRLVATRLQKLIQRNMIDERVARITEVDEFGVEHHEMLRVNHVQEDGSVLNDLTAGEYDFVVTEQPMQVTFGNTQFEQLKDMRGMNPPVAIPDSVMIRYSNLPDKAEIAEAMKAQQQPAQDPLIDAQVAKEQALADRARAESVTKTTEALFSASRVAQLVRADPSIAELADTIYRSAGGVDHDASPVIPTPEAAPLALPPPTSSNPLTPDNPATGVDAGMTAVSELPAPPDEGLPQ